MKFLFAALVLMMMLPACSNDDEFVVTTGDVTVEEADAGSDQQDISVDSTQDVATVEEGD